MSSSAPGNGLANCRLLYPVEGAASRPGARRAVLSCAVPMIRIRIDRLEKSFGGPPIFQDVALEASGGLVAVTGRNGSGKSTLLKILAGLLRASRGSVDLLRDERVVPAAERRRLVGWASPEVEFLDELTAAENLELLARAGGSSPTRREIVARLDRTGLRHPDGRRVAEFSSGMKQRVRLAFSLLWDPPVLLWDEPFSNLDDEGIGYGLGVIRELRRRGIVFLATNDRRDLESPDGEIALS
jgi:heme exporter protein A